MAAKRTCSIDGCGRTTEKGAHGWCGLHYQRWMKWGDPLRTVRNPANQPCSVEGCETKAHGQGLCKLHLDRHYRLGSTTLPRRPSFYERLWSRIDRSAGPDECWPWLGARHRDLGAGQLSDVEGRLVWAHRAAWEAANQACILPGFVIRHRCDNPPCCNPSHLIPGRQADNVRDMIDRGRAWWQKACTTL